MRIIDSLQAYIQDVLEENNSKKDYDIIFRGHSSEAYKLMPSIGRWNEYSLEKEKRVFLDFKKLYYSYTQERPASDMDLLFLAQHYGLPTRLLDWTYNPMIAIYMACQSHDDKDGVVYAQVLPRHRLCDSENSTLMPKSFQEIQDMKKSYFIVPNYTDIRYLNQKALFQIFDQPTHEVTDVKKVYKICGKRKKQIRIDLANLGYDKTFIYPSLDSLCTDIKNKYQIY